MIRHLSSVTVSAAANPFGQVSKRATLLQVGSGQDARRAHNNYLIVRRLSRQLLVK